MGRIIVVTSGKGGVGKSTVCAYLGEQLCKMGRRVLLVDMDEGLRSLDLMLNVSSHTVFDVSDILNGNCTINQAVQPVAKCTNLYLLPAPARVGSITDTGLVRQLFEKLSDSFDYVFIDSPAGVGPGFVNAASNATEALVVVNPDPVSVRDGSYVSLLLRRYGVSAARLIINKVDTRLMLKGTFMNIDEIIDATELQLIAAIPDDERVISCTADGRQLGDCIAADAFERLALRLEGKSVRLPDLRKIT